jgi:hypothetical protein
VYGMFLVYLYFRKGQAAQWLFMPIPPSMRSMCTCFNAEMRGGWWLFEYTLSSAVTHCVFVTILLVLTILVGSLLV